MGLDWRNGDHEICLIDEVSKLMARGFCCYVEYEVFRVDKGKAHHRLVVDIYAIKDNKEIIIEIGTLSSRREKEDRLTYIKELMPDSKIVWVHQWKNYGITNSSIETFTIEKRLRTQAKQELHKIADLLE